MRRGLRTVAETKAFSEDIDSMLSPAERDAVLSNIAAEPDGGDLIQGTGGLRKRRIALPGRGKRGGARVITLSLGDRRPVYAVFLYAKNEREALSPDQRKALNRLVEAIKVEAKARSRP
jgi:hypothetical protein